MIAPLQRVTFNAGAVLLACVIFLGLAMPAAAASTETVEHRIEQLSPHFAIARPEGEGPFPVVLMLHGCGGERPFQHDIAELIARHGAVAVQVDSYAPRRISRVVAFATVCTGARFWGRERAGDLFAAMAWARRQSWADPERIIAIGWSHGGWTILDALSLHSGAEMERATGLSGLAEEPLEGLAAAMMVYPYTGFGSWVGKRDWRMNPPSLAIIAEQDYIVGPTRGALERQRSRGSPLEIVTFDNATHAFEDAKAEDPRVRYNPAATAREHALIAELIERVR